MVVRRSACACALALLLLASAEIASAGTLSLAWDPNTESDLAGYLVRYGTQHGTYTGTVDVGSQTSAVITGLNEGQQYFFVVQAYDTQGLSSNPSTEVAGVVPTPVPGGLVAAFGFEETSGSVTVDSSPMHQTGAITGATRTANGRFGRALSFNGVNNWVTVADSQALDLTTSMTMEAWVNPTTLSGWRSVLMKENDQGIAYAIYANDNDPRPAAYVRMSGNTLSDGSSGTAQLPLNTWSHLAATYDGSNIRLYVNGALVNTQPATGTVTTSSGALRIGGNAVWGEYFSGLIDEVRIYNRALSQGEIVGDMGSAVVSGLVAAYGFEEASGATTTDASQNGNDGTIAGATRVAAGKFGRGLKFDGVSAMVTVPDAPTLDLAQMTVEAWVNPTALSGWRCVVIKEDTSDLAYGIWANNSAPNPMALMNVGGLDQSAVGTAQIPLSTWTHLAETYDGTTIRLFVNGVQVGSTAASGPLARTANPLRIGGNTIWGEYFTGKIDEVRIYNRPLSAAEIQADMASPVQ